MRYGLILLMLTSNAIASPYFRLINTKEPQISAGAFIDPENPGNSSAGTMLALITHSTRDGCALPTVICEDYTPLAIGFATKSGRTIFAFGPSLNLAPLVKSGLFWFVTKVTKEENYQGVKDSLSSENLDRKDISLSFGPALAFSPIDNWKGFFRIFSGAAWRF